MRLGDIKFFEGVVEARNDPLGLGRVQVRVFGLHTADKTEIPTESLPWALVPQFVMSGVGTGPTELVEGSVVFGYFRDGEAAQHPVVIGGWAGIPQESANPSKGFNDPNGLYPKYTGKSDLPSPALGDLSGTVHDQVNASKASDIPKAGDKGSWSERTGEGDPIYPFNKVRQSESGHLMEFDDTPSEERLTLLHRAGSGMQLFKDGAGNIHIMGDDYHVALGDRNLFVKGSLNITAAGDVNLLGVGSVNIDTEGKLNIRANAGINMQSMAPIIINGAVVDVGPATIINAGTPPPLPPLSVNDANADIADARNSAIAAMNLELFSIRGEIDGDVDTEPLSLSTEAIAAIVAENPTAVIDTKPLPAKPAIPAKPVTPVSGDIPPIDYRLQLSKHFSLGDLVKYNVQFKHHDLNALKSSNWEKNGLHVSEIVTNLKGLAVNILDPLLEKFPGMRVNCAWRNESGKSQHPKGMAADLQWPNLTLQQHYEIAQYIKQNLPFDQIILEHGQVSFWVHVSFNSKGGRRSVLSYLDPKVGRWNIPASAAGYASGLSIPTHTSKFSSPTKLKPSSGDMSIVRQPTGPKYKG